MAGLVNGVGWIDIERNTLWPQLSRSFLLSRWNHSYLRIQGLLCRRMHQQSRGEGDTLWGKTTGADSLLHCPGSFEPWDLGLCRRDKNKNCLGTGTVRANFESQGNVNLQRGPAKQEGQVDTEAGRACVVLSLRPPRPVKELRLPLLRQLAHASPRNSGPPLI